MLNTRESVLRRSDKRRGDGVEEVKRGSIPLPKIQRDENVSVTFPHPGLILGEKASNTSSSRTVLPR